MLIQFGADQTIISFSLVEANDEKVVSNYLLKVGMLTTIHKPELFASFSDITFCPPQRFKANWIRRAQTECRKLHFFSSEPKADKLKAKN